ncbi:hypothetical protein PVAP13_2NG428203 [Panicum virgatum]|uniref:Uncharacterized protein n=1 Tax=Panicum virgatum TaxID=38727 RepID=A0A8T0VLS1_PANVG|nr:hypothetical protein PVAP13_2NG428203 [Panicum virgatum]
MEDSPPRRRSKDRASDSAHRRQRSSTDDDETPRRWKSSHDMREESQSRRSGRSSITREDISQRKNTGHDDGHRKRRRSRSGEPGEVSPSEEDGNYKREKTSTEPGQSPDQYTLHHRHHREDTYESRRSTETADAMVTGIAPREARVEITATRSLESRDYSH